MLKIEQYHLSRRVARAVDRRMQAMKIDADQLATRMEMKIDTVAKILGGVGRIRPKTAHKLCTALDVFWPQLNWTWWRRIREWPKGAHHHV